MGKLAVNFVFHGKKRLAWPSFARDILVCFCVFEVFF